MKKVQRLMACGMALFFALGCNEQVAELREDLEYRTARQINAERKRLGLPPLEIRADLRNVARLHNRSMVEAESLGKKGFSHRDGKGRMVEDRLEEYRHSGMWRRRIDWVNVGENLARNHGYADPVAEAVRGWLASPEHRANIVSPRFQETGVGVHRSGKDNTFYFTQVFVSRMPE